MLAPLPLPLPPPPTDCPPPALDAPATLSGCNRGNGIFGYWTIDAGGLPAYEYTFTHLDDERARYGHSSDPDERTHRHLVGNRRLNAIASNDGVVELVSQERGVTFHNRFEPRAGQLAGGFSVIGEGARAWSSAYRFRPAGARTRRVFGLGYALFVTQHDGLRVSHRIVAPSGDDPLLLDEVELQNLSSRQRRLRHYEVWDVNRQQAQFQLARTGGLAALGDNARRQLNRPFEQRLRREGDALVADFALRAGETRGARDEVSAIDSYPASIFAAALSEDGGGDAVEVYSDQQAFFGEGGPTAPTAAASGRAGELLAAHEAYGQRAALILRHDVVLEPGETRRLRFAYGYLPAGVQLAPLLARHAAAGADALTLAHAGWRARLAHFAADDARLQPPQSDAVVARELPWHAYYLLAASTMSDYFAAPVTTQGSAYFYLHGFDGAPRDQALFALPLCYLEPAQAKANLRLIMRMTDVASGQIGYSYHGHGVIEGVLIHQRPSDLDLFLMLALGEYLAATGDHAFLDEQVPFHPLSAAAQGSVLEHLRRAATHLIEAVGVGPHGLVRIRDGDWSDSVVWENRDKADPSKTIENGESVPNSQLALYALPRLAALLEGRDAALAKRLREHAAALVAPVRATLQPAGHFLRAYLRSAQDEAVPLGDGGIDLEAQPWGVLSDVLDETGQRALLEQVYERLDRSSPIGPALWPGGMVWPAIAQLQTWAYARHDPYRAWSSLARQSLATHAEHFPSSWLGIWSGPDGCFSASGKTWSSVATPMTDWPVMNANQHAMYLLGALRVAGIEPALEGGLSLRPTSWPERYTLDFPLLRVAVSAGKLEGVYRAHGAGRTTLVLRAPRGKTLKTATLDGQPIAVTAAGVATLPLSFVAGEERRFAATW